MRTTSVFLWVIVITLAGVSLVALIFVLQFLQVARNIDSNFTLALIYITALTMFIIGSVGYSAARAYNTKDALVGILADGTNRLTPEERVRLINAVESPPRRMRGFSRVVIALTVLFILGVALFSSLTIGIPPTAKDVITPVLGALTGLVAAITGFYYGRLQEQEERPEGEGEGERNEDGQAPATTPVGQDRNSEVQSDDPSKRVQELLRELEDLQDRVNRLLR